MLAVLVAAARPRSLRLLPHAHMSNVGKTSIYGTLEVQTHYSVLSYIKLLSTAVDNQWLMHTCPMWVKPKFMTYWK